MDSCQHWPAPPPTTARPAPGVWCRLETIGFPSHRQEESLFCPMITKALEPVSSLTLLLWGLRTLRGKSKPAPQNSE